jgi:hypothetical protein
MMRFILLGDDNFVFSWWLIVLIVMGFALIVLVAVLFCVLCCFKKKKVIDDIEEGVYEKRKLFVRKGKEKRIAGKSLTTITLENKKSYPLFKPLAFMPSPPPAAPVDENISSSFVERVAAQLGKDAERIPTPKEMNEYETYVEKHQKEILVFKKHVDIVFGRDEHVNEICNKQIKNIEGSLTNATDHSITYKDSAEVNRKSETQATDNSEKNPTTDESLVDYSPIFVEKIDSESLEKQDPGISVSSISTLTDVTSLYGSILQITIPFNQINPP